MQHTRNASKAQTNLRSLQDSERMRCHWITDFFVHAAGLLTNPHTFTDVQTLVVVARVFNCRKRPT